jgi:hypothetical protein
VPADTHKAAKRLAVKEGIEYDDALLKVSKNGAM